MMWQKYKGKFHFLLNADRMEDGRTAQSACQELIEVARKNQTTYPMDNKCGKCSRIAVLINSSIEDSKDDLRREKDMYILRRAFELTQSVTMRKMIRAQIRKLEKELHPLELPEPSKGSR